MTVLIETRRKIRGVRKEEVKKTAKRILELLNCSEAELSILLVDDKEIQVINRDYRKIDSATDVIAFAMREGEFGYINDDMLGDVVISVETAGRQAEEAGREVWNEVRFLLIHGILHLLGYDHVNDDVERKRMEKKEQEILKQLVAN
ncbi:MAG: rRNA maturation RNase YbeY [Proteobacteria bacterium]|nr:rRNA maturation RNase YbeY [Pseudomonadota bacterium]